MSAGSRAWTPPQGDASTTVFERPGVPLLALLLPLSMLFLAPNVSWGQEGTAGEAGANAEPLAAAQAGSQQAANLAGHTDYALVLERAPQVVDLLDKANRFLDWATTAAERSRNNPTPSTRQDAEVLARRATKSFEEYRLAVEEQLKAIELERNPPPPPPPPPPVASSPPPPPPQSTRPPRALRNAASAYLTGDYQQVIELTSSGLRGRKAKARGAMLRAAARYALFLLGGENDYALRGQATNDVLACREADPQLKPPAEVFSPRFRDFFLATQ